MIMTTIATMVSPQAHSERCNTRMDPRPIESEKDVQHENGEQWIIGAVHRSMQTPYSHSSPSYRQARTRFHFASKPSNARRSYPCKDSDRWQLLPQLVWTPVRLVWTPARLGPHLQGHPTRSSLIKKRLQDARTLTEKESLEPRRQ